MTGMVRIEKREGYRMVALDRPDRMNALDAAALHGLLDALGEAEADPTCRALLLTGTGRAFCAGADLASITPGADLGDAIERGWNPLVRRMHGLRMPTVCAVNGMAAGAGANLALGCDIVLAAKSAKFMQAFSKIGLVPDAGGSFLLPRLIGDGRARAMAMLAEPVPAATAEQWGMIWRVLEDDALMGEAHALAARLATMPTHALVLTRRLLAASAGNTFDQQLDAERDTQREAGRTPDFAEGVRAFLEKRLPVFSGRPSL